MSVPYRKQGLCPACKDFFNEPFQLFSPERIKFIRESLGESQKEFARRFFVDFETIKDWEAPEGAAKHRECLNGNARVMIATEKEALKKRNDKARALRSIIARKKRELGDRFNG